MHKNRRLHVKIHKNMHKNQKKPLAFQNKTMYTKPIGK